MRHIKLKNVEIRYKVIESRFGIDTKGIIIIKINMLMQT